MGKLKPIGSEKLEGIQKINRIMEIARYKENIPQSINENSKVDYSITLSDGNQYHIVKEKVGYVIKKSLNESEVDYLEPMRNRKHYSSYSEAFKRLNLIAKEINTLTGYDKNVSLFGESDMDKKYVLRMKEQQAAPENVPPAPAPAPTTPPPAPGPETATPPAPETDMTEPSMDDMDLGLDDEMDMEVDTEVGKEEEVVTLKTIQKITGKLGQKIRQFLSNEENKMSSKDIKYVINSVLSALDLNDLDPEDKEDIMTKFEGGEGISSDMGMGPDTEIDTETEVDVTPDMGDETMTTEPPQNPNPVEEMIENIFSESKVDNILKKYFRIDEKEKRMIQDKKKKTLLENKIKEKTKNRIISLSENISQEVASRKLVEKYPTARLLMKESGNLVFDINNKKIRVTPKGNIK